MFGWNDFFSKNFKWSLIKTFSTIRVFQLPCDCIHNASCTPSCLQYSCFHFFFLFSSISSELYYMSQNCWTLTRLLLEFFFYLMQRGFLIGWNHLMSIYCLSVCLFIEVCLSVCLSEYLFQTRFIKMYLKEKLTQNWKFGHYLLTLMLMEGQVKFFIPQNIAGVL